MLVTGIPILGFCNFGVSNHSSSSPQTGSLSHNLIVVVVVAPRERDRRCRSGSVPSTEVASPDYYSGFSSWALFGSLAVTREILGRVFSSAL